MVALDERFQHKGTKAPRRCRRKDGFGRYSKSPTASATSVNSVACNYYLMQDLLYRPLALTDYSGAIRESYDTDPYGNTLIFSAPDSTGNWWGDAAVQSNYGANEIVYCGYRFDPETQLYYVRNRTYNPVIGRWIQRDPIGYQGGINLYSYVGGNPIIRADPAGLQFSYKQAQAVAPIGYVVVSGTLMPPRGPVVPVGAPQTSESGWIYRTYTKTIHGTETDKYRVRYEDPNVNPPCFETLTVLQTRSVTEVVVANNANAINDAGEAISGVGAVVGGIGIGVGLTGGGLVAGGVIGIVGVGIGIGGQALTWIGSHEEITPSVTITPGPVIADSLSP